MSLRFNETETIYMQYDFTSLKEELIKVGRQLQYSKGMTLQPREGEILVIISGRMVVSNNSKGELLLGDTIPFLPVGLIEHYYKVPLHYHVESNVSVIQLSTEEFEAFFFHNPAHATQLARILTCLSSRLIHIYYERNNDSGYATIREMLHRYLFKREEGSLQNEGIATFILKRTRLSRSYVFHVLSALKTGGYITINNGKLESINRTIPERF